MGNKFHTPKQSWIPVKGFEGLCKAQGFTAISPPIYHTLKTIHSIDLSNDGRIYYVERSLHTNFPITMKYQTSIELNKQTGNIVAIIKDGTEYYVLEMEVMIGTGDIYINSSEGNYIVKRSYYTLENFPKFAITSNKEYNRLLHLFEFLDYSENI